MMSAFINKCPKCRTQVRIRNRELDGKKARCPKCGTAFRIKAPTAASPPREKEPSMEFSVLGRLTDEDLADYGPIDEDLDESADPDEEVVASAPPRKGKKSPSSNASGEKDSPRKNQDFFIGAVVIGGGMLAFAIVGFFAWQLLPGLLSGGDASRLAWMPDDIEVFMEVEPGPLWSARALRSVRESKLGVAFRDFVYEQLSPLDADEIETIAVGFPPQGSPHFVIYAKSTFDAGALKSKAPDFKEVTHGSATYFLGGQPARAAYFPEPGVLVYGVEEQVKAAIDRGGTCAAAEQFVIPAQGMVVFSSRNPQRSGIPTLVEIAGQEAGLTAGAEGLQKYAFIADVEYHADLTGVLVYETPGPADALVTASQDQIEEQISALEFERSERLNTDPTFKLDMDNVKTYLTSQLQVLRSVDLSQSGPQVRLELTIPQFLLTPIFIDAVEFAAERFPEADLAEDVF